MIGQTFGEPAFTRVPWKRFRNQNSETCPVGGVLRIVDCEIDGGEIVALCDKPNDEAQPIYLVNVGPHDVPKYSNSDPREGQCSPLTHHAGLVRYFDQDGTPAYGDFWGPKSQQWSLTNGTGLGSFCILGGNKSSPSRTVAMQVKSSTPKRALAKLTAPVSACDQRTTQLYDQVGPFSSYAVLPSATARLRLTRESSGSVDFSSNFSDATTIYNPTPFVFPTGTLVWVVRADDHWIIERAVAFRPFASYYINDQVVPFGTFPATVKFVEVTNLGGVATVLPSHKVRIDCPMNHSPYRVSWGATIKMNTVTPEDAYFRLVLKGLPLSYIALGENVTNTQGIETFAIEHFSNSVVATLVHGAELELVDESFTSPSFGAHTIQFAYLNIEPLF